MTRNAASQKIRLRCGKGVISLVDGERKMTQSDTTVSESSPSVLERAWPPVGLAIGVVATAGWIGFLAFKLLELFGLAP